MTSSTAKRIEAYVDTSALIAFLDSSDSYHPLFLRLFSAPPMLLTSTLVIAEGHAWFLKRFDQRRASQFLDLVTSLRDTMAIEPFGEAALDDATRIVKRFSDQKLSLADAHGIALMESLGIERCWSADWHMGLTGATLAIH